MDTKIKLPAKQNGLNRKPVRPAEAKATTAKTDAKATPKPAKHDPELTFTPEPVDLADRKFVLEPPAPASTEPQPPAYEHLGDLPESYGTKRLFLTARDPYWLFAYWDLSWHQFMDAARAAHDGKVFLEVSDATGNRVQQVQINEHSRNWYLHVSQADATYSARLGYYDHDGGFVAVSNSGTAKTPRDGLHWRTDTQFATIPFNFTFKELLEMIRAHIKDGEDLGDALARLQDEGFDLPFKPGTRKLGREEQEELLGYLAGDFGKRLWRGSEEITESLRKRLEESTSSGGEWLGARGASSGVISGSESVTSFGGSESVSSFSSPFGGGERNFYMHVNAELIIYGGTDPDAKVRIDGQEIQLRPDGTFSYHWVLPDGKFHIPIEATSPDHVETRSALLSFLRLSEYAGQVDKTGQPPLEEPLGRSE